jgi:crotonobetainyl-CoA:carnitine CoA-transferase CaiB-like acyl-CoA transferase
MLVVLGTATLQPGMRCSCCILFQHLHQARLEGPDRLHTLQAHTHGAHGTRSPSKPTAPHSVYPCTWEDRWLAIACFTEDEWRALTGVAGHPELAADRRFVDLTARLQYQDALTPCSRNGRSPRMPMR